MGNYTTNPLRAGQETEKATGLDTLGGDSVTAELFGIRRLISCDSVRRNLKAIPTRRMLQGCVARISRHGRRNSITVYTAGKEDAASNFAEIANFLHKITSASQLRVEQRWQLIIYWAFRKYRLISFSRVCFLKASPSWRPRMRLTFGIRPECVVRAQGREMQMQSMYKPDRGGRRPSSRRSSRRSQTSSSACST